MSMTIDMKYYHHSICSRNSWVNLHVTLRPVYLGAVNRNGSITRDAALSVDWTFVGGRIDAFGMT